MEFSDGSCAQRCHSPRSLVALKFMSAITQLQIIPQIKAELCPFIKLELHEIKTPFKNVFQKT